MNKINNQYLKQLISEIASKTSEGRITSVSWGLIDEAKRKKILKKEVDEKKKDSAIEEPTKDSTAAEVPNEEPKDTQAGAEDKPQLEPKKDATTDVNIEPASQEVGAEDADKAKEDAAKAKAELEKAKVEKDQAEKEIKKHAYVKLSSSSGTEYLLGKVLDQAFKTNTIDALAGEMIEKLKIKTPEEMSQFSEDVVSYMTIPGMAQLLSSMKTATSNQPEKTEEPSA